MINELGIEVKCENCEYLFDCYEVELCEHYERFTPSNSVLKKRVEELQNQLGIFEKMYNRVLNAYHEVAEQLEDLKAKTRK